VTMDVSIQRNSGFYLFKVMMPLFLITIASWGVFWIDAKEFSTQITIAFTNLLTVVALLLVVNDSLPRVGYLTFMDGFTMLCFAAILVVIVELIWVHRWESRDDHDQAQKIHVMARWIVPSGFLLTCAGLWGIMIGV
jgi:Neurotransmitter-gated ion-channel transmembrane region